MRKFIDFIKKRADQMDIWDIAFAKWDAFAIGMVVGAFYPAFVKGNIIAFTVVISVLSTLLAAKFLRRI
jgi:hypothetical protein